MFKSVSCIYSCTFKLKCLLLLQLMKGSWLRCALLLYRLRKKNMETPYVVHTSLLDGHVTPSERQSTELATVTTERWYMAPGVRRIDIRQHGVVGTLFLPPGELRTWSMTLTCFKTGDWKHCVNLLYWFPAGPGPFPAMLDLWGMGGGLVEYRSALFASRGYASLSLAYLGHKDLPAPQNRINVGDSYFKVRQDADFILSILCSFLSESCICVT